VAFAFVTASSGCSPAVEQEKSKTNPLSNFPKNPLLETAVGFSFFNHQPFQKL